MTLWVDSRRGSKELLEPLHARGLPADLTTLAFGDLAFEGRGINGASLQVGIEFKRLGEFVESLRTKRFQGHQTPGLQQMFDVRYLLVEGELLFDHRTGTLVKRTGRRHTAPLPGRMGIAEYMKRWAVLQACGGIIPVRSHTRDESLRWIEALYRVWTDKALDEHKSHLGAYLPTGRAVPLNQFRLTTSTLPGVGPEKFSLAAQRRFKSLRAAFLAPTSAWAELTSVGKDGRERRLGHKAAARIVEEILREYP